MNRKLVIAPSLPIGIGRPGKVRLTGKFLSGMQSYTDLWDGPITLVAEPDEAPGTDNLDDLWVDPDTLPYELVIAPFDTAKARETMLSAGVVMGGTDHRLNGVAAECARQGVPYVLVTEYSLQTRYQVIDADNPPFWRRWRRRAWARGQERANESSARHAAGVQCNGTPTYEAYKDLNANTLLYFDSRVSEDMIPSAGSLVDLPSAWTTERPLRLAFSGRLNAMKGADHLVNVAVALKKAGLPFVMEILGDGPLKASMASEIAANGLNDQVHLKGVLDFATELMPHLRTSVDLFVCCHRQGDPSCTYLETIACGVPIVGYDNEAFAGLLRICDAGRQVPMGDSNALAQVIVELSRSPGTMRKMAEAGIAFARERTFEREFFRRIEHMKSLLRAT